MSEKRPARILIVEDHAEMLQVLQKFLTEKGYEILEADTGENALKLIPDNKPAIILLDIMLPKVDGISLLKRIMNDETLKKVKVVIITNMEDPSKKEEAMRLGAVEYLLKINFTPKKVIDHISKHLV